MEKITTIQVDKKLKAELELLKSHPRETFNELISRLILSSSTTPASRESLVATVEVLSDPEMMLGISEALKEEGGVRLEDFESEL